MTKKCLLLTPSDFSPTRRRKEKNTWEEKIITSDLFHAPVVFLSSTQQLGSLPNLSGGHHLHRIFHISLVPIFHKTKGGSAEPSIRKPGHPLVSALAFEYLCNTMNQPVPHSILSANSLALTRQDNCFDILRYYLALVVFCTHFSVLTQAFTFDWITSSGEAVSGFFCLSGFLVCLSYLKTPDLRTYVSKRLRRILPPYWFIVLLCAFGGVCLTHYTAAGYFTHGQWWRYLLSNLTFLNFLGPTLPGVFEQNPETAVNGSLWTLKIEIMLYATVPIAFALLKRYAKPVVLLGIFAFSITYKEIFACLYQQSGNAFYAILERQVGSQLIYFYAGTAVLLYFEHLMRYAKPLLLTVWAVYLLNNRLPGYDYFSPFVFALLLILTAYQLPKLNIVRHLPNLSYGIYLFHAPIIQAATQLGLPQQHPWLAFVLCLLTTVGLAYLSWHWIEKPFLKRRQPDAKK